MKKGIQILSAILCLIICLASFTGCYKDELRFLYKKMDEFEIECKDYSLIQSEEELSTGQHVKIIYDGTFLLNGNELKIEYQNNLDGFKLTYQNKELNVNSHFMCTYSKTYYNIHKIWDNWNNGNNKKNQEQEPDFTVNDVVGVIVYDNEIFIFVWHENRMLQKREFGNIPYHFYKFNILTNELLYCGYLRKTGEQMKYLKYTYITKINND